MERVKLDCPNCGSSLNKIETQKDTYVCLHCGHKEIIKKEDMPTNYYINQTITKNVFGNEKLSEEDYYKILKNAEKYIGIEDYRKAVSLANKAKKIDEGIYLAWWLSAKSKLLYNLKHKKDESLVIYYPLNSINKDYNKAYNFAEEGMKEKIATEFELLMVEYNSLLEEQGVSVQKNKTLADMDKSIKRANIALSVFFMYFLCSLILVMALVEEKSAAIGPAVFLVILLLIWAGVEGNFKKKKEIINFVKSKNSVSLKEIYDFIMRPYLKLKLNSFDKMDEKALKNDIDSLIENGYLYDYKRDGDNVIKVSNSNNETDNI